MDRKTKFQKKHSSAMFISTADFMPIVEEKIANGQSVELSPRGISMLPLLREGRDSVVLSPITQRLKKYDIALYRRPDGSYILHRIVAVKDGVYTIVGDNQFVYERGVTDQQMIAVVTSIRRGKKLISAESRRQRIYAVLLHRTRAIRHLPRRLVRKIKRLLWH